LGYNLFKNFDYVKLHQYAYKIVTQFMEKLTSFTCFRRKGDVHNYLNEGNVDFSFSVFVLFMNF